MAIEKLLEAMPLQYLQYDVSKWGTTNVLLAMVATVVAGVLMDYMWMLYLRSKMVRKQFVQVKGC
jgi:hypothetical protein